MAVITTTATGITIRGTQDFDSFDESFRVAIGVNCAIDIVGVCSKRNFRDNFGYCRRIDVPIPAVHAPVNNNNVMINIQAVKILLILRVVIDYNEIVIPTVRECQTFSNLSMNSNAAPYCATKLGISIRRVGLTI